MAYFEWDYLLYVLALRDLAPLIQQPFMHDQEVRQRAAFVIHPTCDVYRWPSPLSLRCLSAYRVIRTNALVA